MGWASLLKTALRLGGRATKATFSTMGRAYTHTYLVWTERGRKFIHDLAQRYWELIER